MRIEGSIPEELKALCRWVTWHYENRCGKATKRPEQRINSPGEWLPFKTARSRVAEGHSDGLGFVLGAGVVGIDLDGCIAHDGTLHDIARDAIALSTYAERSPSGRGLHMLIRAKIVRSFKASAGKGVPGREIYDGRTASARFFTVTGDRVGEASEVRSGPSAQAALDAFVATWFPKGIGPLVAHADAISEERLDDEEVIRALFDASDGRRWRRIFYGDFSGYASQSEADLALCRKLRFYSRANAGQMERVFRRSGLMRPKWDERHGAQTYGEGTIAKAISAGGPLYTARHTTGDETKRDAWERKAWAKVPAWVLIRQGGIGELACRVYGIIACYADAKTREAWPSVQSIAAHLRISERRVKTAIAKLKAADLITSTPRPGTSSLYRLARRVPEAITPFATRRKALRVMEPGHLGCLSHGTITNQEPTTIDTGGGKEAA